MKRTLLVLFLALLSPVLASAQTTPLDSCPLPASAMRVAYDETFTVSSSAVGFTAATYAPTNGSPKAVCAVVVVNSNSISWRASGATPTAVIGNVQASGTSFVVGAANLASFLMIRVTSDAVVFVNYMVPNP